MNVRARSFPLVDGLRAVAALLVIVHHAGIFAVLGGTGSVLRPYVARLDVGVAIFFLISGFLLYRPFIRARFRAVGSPRTTAYAWRRFLRIVPAYWVALTVVAVWIGLPHVLEPSRIPTFYGFAQVYTPKSNFEGIKQAWTLCVEVTFYAFLPVWALLMRRTYRTNDRRRIMVQEFTALALLFAASVAYKYWALKHVSLLSLESVPYTHVLPAFLDQFALGMGLAVVSAAYETEPARTPSGVKFFESYPVLGWVLAAIAFWVVSTRIGLHSDLTTLTSSPRVFIERHELYGLVGLGLVGSAAFASARAGVVQSVLGNRAMLYLGLISYGIYLYHVAVLTQVERSFDRLAGLPVGLRVAVYFITATLGASALATVSYYCVERPALSLKRLIRSAPAETPPGEAIAEAAPTRT